MATDEALNHLTDTAGRLSNLGRFFTQVKYGLGVDPDKPFSPTASPDDLCPGCDRKDCGDCIYA